MNINQIEWCSYTEGNPDYVQEIEFLEWQSDPEGKFCKSDVCKLFQSITFAYSKDKILNDISFEIKAGKVEYRVDKTAIVHCPIGKKSFGVEKLQENFHALMDALVKAKPAAAKGQYIKSVSVSSTMGPGAKINPTKVLD